MPFRSIRWRGFGVTVEVPSSLALRWTGGFGQPSPPALQIEHPRAVAVAHHDADESIAFFYNPRHDPEATGLDPERFRIQREVAERLSDDPTEVDRICAVTWYHTIELPGGVVTPGEYDHRPLVPHYGLPISLAGRSALDIGTNNGFWAFELERRGADTSAVDVEMISELDFPRGGRDRIAELGVDIPVGSGFEVAHRLIGSKVKKVVTNVYDLDPTIHGTYDFVHIADILLHLRDPLLALQRVRSVTGSEALIVDVFDPSLPPSSRLTNYDGGWNGLVWWRPSLGTLAQMIVDAGFESAELLSTFNLPHTWGEGPWRAVFRART